MSSEEMVVVTKRKTNKLCLDSSEEARLQVEQRQKEEQVRLRKEERRKRKEDQVRKIQQETKKRLQQRQKYQNPETMLIEDSDSRDLFERVQRKIRRSYPDFKPKEEIVKRKHVSQSSGSDEQSDEDSESEESQEIQKKKKAEKKVKKERHQKKANNPQQVRQIKHKLQKVKIEQQDPKEKLVKQVAIRWWYCIAEWPPKNYPYEAQLKKMGYRLVEFSQFRMEQNLVNGLYKAHPVEGYTGVFRSKLKIIDIRPNKELAPSLKLLRSKSGQQLVTLLKKALREQHRQLNAQKYLLSEETELLSEIQRRLKQLN